MDGHVCVYIYIYILYIYIYILYSSIFYIAPGRASLTSYPTIKQHWKLKSKHLLGDEINELKQIYEFVYRYVTL